jgi:hypothetical protein
MIFTLIKSTFNYLIPFSKTESTTDDKNKFIEGYTTINLFSTITLENEGYLVITPSKTNHSNNSFKIKLTKSNDNKKKNNKKKDNKKKNNEEKDNNIEKEKNFSFFVLLKHGKYDINSADENNIVGLKSIKFEVSKQESCDNKNCEKININRLFRNINQLKIENIDCID